MALKDISGDFKAVILVSVNNLLGYIIKGSSVIVLESLMGSNII